MEIIDFFNEKKFSGEKCQLRLCELSAERACQNKMESIKLFGGFFGVFFCLSVFSAQQDAVFELVSMGFNVALWYTKYASRLAGKEE